MYSPTIEPLLDEIAHGITAGNAENLSVARRPASITEELPAFMTRAEGVCYEKKRKKAYMGLVCLDHKPSYSTEVAVRPYPTAYTVPKFEWFMSEKELPKSTFDHA